MASQTPVWFITGGSSGFGKSVAFDALRRGHKVIATSRRLHALAELKDAGAEILELDVTAPEQALASKVEQVVQVYGYITHVFHAAGYALGGANESITYVLIPPVTTTRVAANPYSAKLRP